MGTKDISFISEVLIPLSLTCHFCGQVKYIEFTASAGASIGSYMCRDCRQGVLVSLGLESEINEKAVAIGSSELSAGSLCRNR